MAWNGHPGSHFVRCHGCPGGHLVLAEGRTASMAAAGRGSAVGAAVAAPPLGLSSLLPDPGLYLGTGQCPEHRGVLGGSSRPESPPTPYPQPSLPSAFAIPHFSIHSSVPVTGVAFSYLYTLTKKCHQCHRQVLLCPVEELMVLSGTGCVWHQAAPVPP